MLTVLSDKKQMGEGIIHPTPICLFYYVNPTSEDFDANKQYAFIRKYKKETLIVVANFADNKTLTKLNIPEHAFDFLHLPKGMMQAEDLMTGEKSTVCLSCESRLTMNMTPLSARILKIKE